MGHSGARTLTIPPEEILKKEDMPTELQNLEQPEWEKKYCKWMNTHFTAGKLHEPGFVPGLKHYISNSAMTNLMFEALAAHELGHCYHNHWLKAVFATFGWQLLSLPTLGISTLFEERVIGNFMRPREKEADLFAAIKLDSAKGLVPFFEMPCVENKALKQYYPDQFDAEGNNRTDKTHPPLTERIAYLKPFIKP